MPASFNAHLITCSIDGTLRRVLLEDYSDAVGATPSSAECILVDERAHVFDTALINGKAAIVYVDGVPLVTGRCYALRQRYQDQSVRIRILDNRHLLRKEWVGRRHLGNSGLRFLGADVTFNLGNKPNRSDTDSGGEPVFVYEKGNVSDPEDCANTDAVYWTYGAALRWLWMQYVDDVDYPLVAGTLAAQTIFDFGGMERDAGELPLFGLRVDQAIDVIFRLTNCNWTLLPSAVAIIFHKDTNAGGLVLQMPDPASPIVNTNYSLDMPVELECFDSIEDIATSVDVVGGRTIREATFVAADFDDPRVDKRLIPTPAPVVEETATIVTLFWANYDKTPRWVIPMKKDVYETHGLGKNIRRKEPAKPMLGELLIKRDREGNMVNPDSECGVYPVETGEGHIGLYPFGVGIDFSRSELTVVSGVEPPVPIRLTTAVETELREAIEITGGLAGLPEAFHLPIIREDIRHENREATIIAVAVDVIWTIYGNVSPAVSQWTATPAVGLPTGATLVGPNVSADGTHWEFFGFITTSGSIPPGDWSMTLPAGTVFDGNAALTEIGAILTEQIGRPIVHVAGAFPVMRDLPIGTRLSVSAGRYALTGDEMVVARHFDGSTMKFSFVATNRLGADATELGRSFIDRRRQRRAV